MATTKPKSNKTMSAAQFINLIGRKLMGPEQTARFLTGNQKAGHRLTADGWRGEVAEWKAIEANNAPVPGVPDPPPPPPDPDDPEQGPKA